MASASTIAPAIAPRFARALGFALASLSLLGVAPHAAADQGAAQCDRTVAQVFATASPAVVLITAQSIDPYRLQNRITQQLGSGFISTAEGLVLTNSHVVYGMQSVSVTLDDGTVVPGRLVGADPIFDLAVVQIAKPDGGALPVLALGDSDHVRPGEEVMAIGNPFGLDQTVTHGIVSGINRLLLETPLTAQESLIQTDAAINPGNSGGPLLNRCGEVVGINTAIIPDAQNIGFAIPVNLAKSILPSLIANGRVIRPWIGFHGQLIDSELRKLALLPLEHGQLVEVIEPGSPAEQAGMQGGHAELSLGGASFLLGGDIVVEMNGVAAADGEKFTAALRTIAVGSTLRLKVYRQGKYRDVEYVLPERPLLPGDIPGAGDAESGSSAGGAPRRLHHRR